MMARLLGVASLRQDESGADVEQAACLTEALLPLAEIVMPFHAGEFEGGTRSGQYRFPVIQANGVKVVAVPPHLMKFATPLVGLPFLAR
jgi:hypothetical protein